MKEWIVKTLGVKTYEDDFAELSKNHIELGQKYEDLKKLDEVHKAQIQNLTDQFVELKQDPEGFWMKELQTYIDDVEAKFNAVETWYTKENEIAKKTIEALEEENAKLKRENETIEHRGISIGRMDAYSQMGIRNIQAHERGNNLVMDEHGNIFELLQGLVDVQEETEVPKDADGVLADDEVTIDDLEENDDFVENEVEE